MARNFALRGFDQGAVGELAGDERDELGRRAASVGIARSTAARTSRVGPGQRQDAGERLALGRRRVAMRRAASSRAIRLAAGSAPGGLSSGLDEPRDSRAARLGGRSLRRAAGRARLVGRLARRRLCRVGGSCGRARGRRAGRSAQGVRASRRGPPTTPRLIHRVDHVTPCCRTPDIDGTTRARAAAGPGADKSRSPPQISRPTRAAAAPRRNSTPVLQPYRRDAEVTVFYAFQKAVDPGVPRGRRRPRPAVQPAA